MSARNKRRLVPQMLLSLLLGLAIVGIVGVGIRTAYPSPSQSVIKLKQLDDQQKALEASRKLTGSMSGSHKAYYNKLMDNIAAEKKVVLTGRLAWDRNTEMILVALATLTMGASLVTARQLLVVSDGLVLGGFLTMLYAVVRSFSGSESGIRYAIIAIALVVTAAVGYVKYSQERRNAEATAEA